MHIEDWQYFINYNCCWSMVGVSWLINLSHNLFFSEFYALMMLMLLLQNSSQSKILVRMFLMLTEHFPGPCGPFVVVILGVVIGCRISVFVV